MTSRLDSSAVASCSCASSPGNRYQVVPRSGISLPSRFTGRMFCNVSTHSDHLTAALSQSYRIERELGAGGMATVYLAHDVRHERKVALKMLHPDLAATIGVDRFLSEIKVTANLQHPNILGLFDSGIADGQAYYVMPYVDGESLRDRLKRETQLPVADAIAIASGVAAALEYAHAR